MSNKERQPLRLPNGKKAAPEGTAVSVKLVQPYQAFDSENAAAANIPSNMSASIEHLQA